MSCARTRERKIAKKSCVFSDAMGARRNATPGADVAPNSSRVPQQFSLGRKKYERTVTHGADATQR